MTGGVLPIMAKPPAITMAQARFLRFFLAGPPDRAVWLAGGRRISKVAEPFAYEPSATHLLVYRLAQGEDDALRGDAIDRHRISLTDLRSLWPLWAEPLRTLNAGGVSAARTRLPKRSRVTAFRQTETERALLAADAAQRGLPAGVIVAEIVRDYLTNRERLGLKTANAGNSDGR